MIWSQKKLPKFWRIVTGELDKRMRLRGSCGLVNLLATHKCEQCIMTLVQQIPPRVFIARGVCYSVHKQRSHRASKITYHNGHFPHRKCEFTPHARKQITLYSYLNIFRIKPNSSNQDNLQSRNLQYLTFLQLTKYIFATDSSAVRLATQNQGQKSSCSLTTVSHKL